MQVRWFFFELIEFVIVVDDVIFVVVIFVVVFIVVGVIVVIAVGGVDNIAIVIVINSLQTGTGAAATIPHILAFETTEHILCLRFITSQIVITEVAAHVPSLQLFGGRDIRNPRFAPALQGLNINSENQSQGKKTDKKRMGPVRGKA